MQRRSRSTLQRAVMLCCAAVLAGCASMEDDWQKARKFDSSFLYESFLRNHADSEYAPQARRRLLELKWEAARRDGKIETIEKFIADNPTNPFRGQAEARVVEIHRKTYDDARGKSSIQGLQEFLQKNPKSPHVAEATGELDEMMFTDARQKADLGAYKAYSKRFPNGRHADAARDAAAPLKAAALAADSWARGEAAPACAWVCEDKACVDDIDKTLWSMLSGPLLKMRGPGGGYAGYSFTQTPEYSCNARVVRSERSFDEASCVDRRTGATAGYEVRVGQPEVLSMTRLQCSPVALETQLRLRRFNAAAHSGRRRPRASSCRRRPTFPTAGEPRRRAAASR